MSGAIAPFPLLYFVEILEILNCENCFLTLGTSLRDIRKRPRIPASVAHSLA